MDGINFRILTSLPFILHPIVTILLLLSTIITSYAFYNAYLHPLRHYPGPLLWRSFRFPHVVSTHRGELHKRLKDFHTRYGPVVRVAPNELSYADSRAIKDIYMNRPGHLPFERNRTSFKKMSPDEPNSIVGFDEHDHARYRRAFANAFSEKALKDQAPVIERHVSDFTSQLRSLSSSKEQKESVIDFEKWFNYLTFDISGEFTFGESFNCVKSGAPHFWVQVTQDFGKGLAMIGTINHYPPFDKLLRYVIPKRILERSFTHRKLTMEKAKQRLAQSNPSANDWVTPTKKFSDAKDPFTEAEWGINLLVIAFAASETTASALCVILRSLLQNKGVLHRLTREIRTSFPSESDITIATTSNLSYLNAVINEGMRLGPPVVIGIPRVVPEGGDTVCGAWVPGGTHVTFNQYPAYRQSYNFHAPNSFIPERFLSTNIAADGDDMASFQPFQIGRHACIGINVAWREMRLTVARLLWAFDVRLADEKGDRWDWGTQRTFILWDKEPLNVVLRSAGTGGE